MPMSSVNIYTVKVGGESNKQDLLNYTHGHGLPRRKLSVISVLLYIVCTSTHNRNG